ncbi:hypothetical protein [Sphingomonas sp.]|uniref:hypothetical protein n=1 Tax=Sphingomonas sp. TaxID=28214 RepID=UPI002BD62FCB|nr:hypothetical protein [Sphingomonas sp.]HWK36495.1 hypothetical protein [Sphingomonas sp.]
MPFREKIAWVSLAGIVAAFTPYFVLVGHYSGPASAYAGFSVGLLIGMVVVLTILVTVASIGVALTNIRDAQAPADERDHTVARRASSIAYAVLLPALFFAMATVLLGWSAIGVINAVLAAVVLAELARNALEIVCYRRGW